MKPASKRISVEEIMERLCVGEATVYDLLRRHEIPALRLARNWIISRYAYMRWERSFGERSKLAS